MENWGTGFQDPVLRSSDSAGSLCIHKLSRFVQMVPQELDGEELLKELLDQSRPEEGCELWSNLRLDWVQNWDQSCRTMVLLSRLQHTGKSEPRTLSPGCSAPHESSSCPSELSSCDSGVLWHYLTALHDQRRVIDWIQNQESSSCWPEISPELVDRSTVCSSYMREMILDLLARCSTLFKLCRSWFWD